MPPFRLQSQFHRRHTQAARIIPALLLLFIVLPFVELYLLFHLADATSPLTALIIIIVTGILGGILARSQGLIVIRRLRQDVRHGKLPADSLFDGALVLVGGVLLITPGIITDAIGFVLLIPPSRKLIKTNIRKRIKAKITLAGTGRQ
ncbi:MAG: FxsA family protein, partial [Planctomycetes bacterium]|nr:FxsA family protein [Planctomycetota bacterium]